MATPAPEQVAPAPVAPEADTKVVSSATSDTESGGQISPKPARTITQRLSEELDVSKAFIPMLVCCFLSGLTDGTIYNAYKTFVSMQTGNTIFVALGTSKHANPYGWARSLMSIGCFAIGSLIFARIYLLMGGRRRGTLMASFAFQAVCVMIAAAVIQGRVLDGTYPSPKKAGEIDFHELIPIALLSFQAAGQIVSSRSLGVNELPTVVITSMVCDLMSDPLLFGNQRNDKRNRRAIAFVLTLVGAIAGGGISDASGSVQASLWLVCGIKFCLAVTWMFWVKKEDKPKPAEPKA